MLAVGFQLNDVITLTAYRTRNMMSYVKLWTYVSMRSKIIKQEVNVVKGART